MPLTDGSLRRLMDALVALEADAVEAIKEQMSPQDAPRPYRWKPVENAQLPALWNWIVPGTFEHHDTQTYSDTLFIVVSIAIAHAGRDEDMALIEEYADIVRTVMDPAILRRPPLDGQSASWGNRSGMRLEGDEINAVPVLTIQLPYQFELLRRYA